MTLNVDDFVEELSLSERIFLLCISKNGKIDGRHGYTKKIFLGSIITQLILHKRLKKENNYIKIKTNTLNTSLSESPDELLKKAMELISHFESTPVDLRTLTQYLSKAKHFKLKNIKKRILQRLVLLDLVYTMQGKNTKKIYLTEAGTAVKQTLLDTITCIKNLYTPSEIRKYQCDIEESFTNTDFACTNLFSLLDPRDKILKRSSISSYSSCPNLSMYNHSSSGSFDSKDTIFPRHKSFDFLRSRSKSISF